MITALLAALLLHQLLESWNSYFITRMNYKTWQREIDDARNNLDIAKKLLSDRTDEIRFLANKVREIEVKQK